MSFTGDSVKIAWAKPNLYVITVASEVVAKKLIEKGPWLVHDDVFSVQPWPLYCTLEKIMPCRASFLVQAHGIPLGQMTVVNARVIAEWIGNVIMVEDPIATGTRGYLRMRVDINTNMPLLIGFRLLRKDGSKYLIRLR